MDFDQCFELFENDNNDIQDEFGTIINEDFHEDFICDDFEDWSGGYKDFTKKTNITYAYIGGNLSSPIYDHSANLLLELESPICNRHKKLKKLVDRLGIVGTMKDNCNFAQVCIDKYLRTYIMEAADCDMKDMLVILIKSACRSTMEHERSTMSPFLNCSANEKLTEKYNEMMKYLTNNTDIIFPDYRLMKVSEFIKDKICYKEIEHGKMLRHRDLWFEKDLMIFPCPDHGDLLGSTNQLLCCLDKFQARFMLKLYWLIADFNKKYQYSLFSTGCHLLEIFECKRLKMGQKFFKFLKLWESLLVGFVISDKRDLNFTELFLNTRCEMEEILTESNLDPNFIEEILPNARDDDCIKMWLELSGINKAMGFPTLKIECLLDQIREYGGEPKNSPNDEVIRLALAIGKRDFACAYFDKNSRYPPMDGRTIEPKLRKFIDGNKIATKEVLDDLNLWADIVFLKVFEYDTSPDGSELIKDSAAAIVREAYPASYDACMYKHWYNKKPPPYDKDKVVSKRIIERYLQGEELETQKKLTDLINGYFDDDDKIAEQCGKEKELTINGGRAFTKQTYRQRLAQCSMEMNLSRSFFRYLPEQSMTDPEITLTRRVLKNVTEMSKNSDNINLDLTKWNLCFRHALVHRFGRFIDELFNTPRLYEYNHLWFIDSLLLTNSREHPPDYDKEGNPIDGPFCVTQHFGGLEGMRQKLWTFITICLIKFTAKTLGLNINILGQGDNQVIIVNYSQEQIKDRQRLRTIFLDQLKETFGAVNLELKQSETWFSNRLHEYGKVRYYNSTPVSQATKKCVSFVPDSTESYQTLFSPMSTINTLTESIASKDTSSEPAFFLNQFAQMNYLERKRIISKRDSYKFCIAMFFPADFGGLPVTTHFDHVVRGHDDKVSLWLGIYMSLRIHDQSLFESIVSLCQFVPKNEVTEKDKERLLEDIFCLNIQTFKTMEQLVKKLSLNFIQSDYVKNIEIRKLFESDLSIRKETLITSILSMRPLFVQLGHSLLEYSNYGIILSLRNKLSNVNTISKIIQNKENISYIEQMHVSNSQLVIDIRARLKKKYIPNLNLFTDFDCPTKLAEHLRHLSWKTDLVSLTRTCPMHQIKVLPWDEIDVLLRPTSMSITISEQLVNYPYIADYEKGPFSEFVGSVTKEKVKKPNIEINEKTPYVKAIKNLGTIHSWARNLGATNVQHFVRMLIAEKREVIPEGVNEDNIDEWAAISYGGCVFHRFFASIQRSAAILNFMTSICSHFSMSTSTLATTTAGGVDLTIFWQLIMLFVSYGLSSLGKLEKLKSGHYGAIFSCGSCTKIVPDVDFDIKTLPDNYVLPPTPSERPYTIPKYSPEDMCSLITYRIGRKFGENVDRTARALNRHFISNSKTRDVTKIDISANDVRLVDLRDLLFTICGWSEQFVKLLLEKDNSMIQHHKGAFFESVCKMIMDCGMTHVIFELFPDSVSEHTQVTDPTVMSSFLIIQLINLIKKNMRDFIEFNLKIELKDDKFDKKKKHIRRMSRLMSMNDRGETDELIRKVLSSSNSPQHCIFTFSLAFSITTRIFLITDDEIQLSWRSMRLPDYLPKFRPVQQLRTSYVLQNYPYNDFKNYHLSRFANQNNIKRLDIPKNISHLGRSLGFISTAVSKIFEIILYFGLNELIGKLKNCYTLAEGSGSIATGFYKQWPNLSIGYNTLLTPKIDKRLDCTHHYPPSLMSSGQYDPNRMIGQHLLSQGETNIISNEFLKKIELVFQFNPPDIITMDAESNDPSNNLIFVEAYIDMIFKYGPVITIFKIFYSETIYSSITNMFEKRFGDDFLNTRMIWGIIKPTTSSPRSGEMFLVILNKLKLIDVDFDDIMIKLQETHTIYKALKYLEKEKWTDLDQSHYIELSSSINVKLFKMSNSFTESNRSKVVDKYCGWVGSLRSCSYFCKKFVQELLIKLERIHGSTDSDIVYLNIREGGTGFNLIELMNMIIFIFVTVMMEGDINKVIFQLKHIKVGELVTLRETGLKYQLFEICEENDFINNFDQFKMFLRRIPFYKQCTCNMRKRNLGSYQETGQQITKVFFNSLSDFSLLPKDIRWESFFVDLTKKG